MYLHFCQFISQWQYVIYIIHYTLKVTCSPLMAHKKLDNKTKNQHTTKNQKPDSVAYFVSNWNWASSINMYTYHLHVSATGQIINTPYWQIRYFPTSGHIQMLWNSCPLVVFTGPSIAICCRLTGFATTDCRLVTLFFLVSYLNWSCLTLAYNTVCTESQWFCCIQPVTIMVNTTHLSRI